MFLLHFRCMIHSITYHATKAANVINGKIISHVEAKYKTLNRITPAVNTAKIVSVTNKTERANPDLNEANHHASVKAGHISITGGIKIKTSSQPLNTHIVKPYHRATYRIINAAHTIFSFFELLCILSSHPVCSLCSIMHGTVIFVNRQYINSCPI